MKLFDVTPEEGPSVCLVRSDKMQITYIDRIAQIILANCYFILGGPSDFQISDF